VTLAVDEALRMRALDVLGPLGDPTAREVLDVGTVSVAHDVTSWEGSGGRVRGHRVVVIAPSAVHARFSASHAAADALTAALAAAMAERPGESVAAVEVRAGIPEWHGGGGPYRASRA